MYKCITMGSKVKKKDGTNFEDGREIAKVIGFSSGEELICHLDYAAGQEEEIKLEVV